METLLWMSAIPLVAAALSFVVSDIRITRRIVPILLWIQLGQLAFLCAPLFNMGQGNSLALMTLTNDFVIDRTGALFLLLTTVVAASALTHAQVFFPQEEMLSPGHKPEHERFFYASSSLFLLAMTFVFICNNLGFLWISIEATTLSSAPLVYFSRTKHSLEATWKYLIICSVGIAFALFGTVLIFASSQHGALPKGSLNITELMTVAPQLQYSLLRFGYIFCLLGFGTKAGIFPLHSWLPDAHSEAPAPASAMLSGSLLNCALFAIWRLSTLVTAANHSNLSFLLPVGLGTVTAVAASLFLVRQHGIKRLWAYSSIENVGLMLVAIGLGSGALFFLQALNHSLAKVALFLLSGNVVQATGTKEIHEIRGILQLCPAWGVAFALAAFAVTGAPPFGAFISEWLILAQGADLQQWLVVGALILALALSFVAVCIHVARILLGTPKEHTHVFSPLRGSLIPAMLAVITIMTGLTSLPSYLVSLQ